MSSENKTKIVRVNTNEFILFISARNGFWLAGLAYTEKEIRLWFTDNSDDSLSGLDHLQNGQTLEVKCKTGDTK